MRNAVNTTESREVRAGKEADDLDELMSIIDPAEGEDTDEGDEGAGADDDLSEFIGEDLPPARAPDEEEGGEAEDAPAPAADADAAPAAQPPRADEGISELTRLLAQRERREQEAQQAAADAAAATDAAPKPLYDDAATQLTEEELAVYEQSRPTIEKIVRAELQKYHSTTQPQFASTIEELRTNLAAVRPQINQSNDAAFAAALRTSVPDLDSRVKDPKWQEYLGAAIPYQGGRTFGQALYEAVNVTRDVGMALEIVNGFAVPAQEEAPQRSKAPARAGGGGAPASVAAAVRQGGMKPSKVPYSKFLRATEMVQAGKLTPDKYQKVSDYYMDAHEAGLVDYNA